MHAMFNEYCITKNTNFINSKKLLEIVRLRNERDQIGHCCQKKKTHQCVQACMRTKTSFITRQVAWLLNISAREKIVNKFCFLGIANACRAITIVTHVLLSSRILHILQIKIFVNNIRYGSKVPSSGMKDTNPCTLQL